MEEIARTRLADERPPPHRHVRAVPPLPLGVVAVEEADFLERRPADLRMPAEVRVERRRPRLLRAEDEEVRQGPQASSRAAVCAVAAAKRFASRLRQRWNELGR